jgi:Tol biopolymer transport system component
MQIRWKWLALAASALVVAAVAVAIAVSGDNEGGKKDSPNSATDGEASAPSQPSFVVSGSSNIYVVDVATRSVDQLTRNVEAEDAREPTWSAKGGIAFSEASSTDELAKLFVIAPDGSGRKRVPTRAGHLFQPSWAPDGRRIAVTKLGTGLYVVTFPSGELRRLRKTRASDDAPAWSPDGKTIAFHRQISAENWDLYGLDPTGTGLRRLTRDSLQQTNPTWAPDGSRLAFAEQQRNGNWAIFSMKLDGSDRRRLTDPNLSCQEPAWSPDGKRIAFVLQEGERTSIAVVDIAGRKPVRLTPRSLVTPANPIWSPDGKQVAFASRRAARPPPAP